MQGVYFRVSAKQKALNLGVRGFVQNDSDGTVSVEVEGEPNAVEQMVSWCKKGPGLARVKAIEVTELPARNFVSFDIKK
ncbi:MAG: acylphosphatase [Bacteroidia bacterium]